MLRLLPFLLIAITACSSSYTKVRVLHVKESALDPEVRHLQLVIEMENRSPKPVRLTDFTYGTDENARITAVERYLAPQTTAIIDVRLVLDSPTDTILGELRGLWDNVPRKWQVKTKLQGASKPVALSLVID